MDLNSPKQMELCFTLEEKQATTHNLPSQGTSVFSDEVRTPA